MVRLPARYFGRMSIAEIMAEIKDCDIADYELQHEEAKMTERYEQMRFRSSSVFATATWADIVQGQREDGTLIVIRPRNEKHKEEIEAKITEAEKAGFKFDDKYLLQFTDDD